MQQLTQAECEWLRGQGADRFYVKRRVGIGALRTDGSTYNRDTDAQAAGAEYFGCRGLGLPYNSAILTHGDGGHDAVFNFGVEFYHAAHPRAKYGIIVHAEESHRWADVYVSVVGTLEQGYKFAGWITHKRLVTLPRVEFGYGGRFACLFEQLYPIEMLLELKR